MQERRPKRQRPLPSCLGNGHDATYSSDKSEASSEVDAPDETAETPPRAWVGAAQRVPNGRSLRMDCSSGHEDLVHQPSSKAAAQKRLKTTLSSQVSLPRAVASCEVTQRTNGTALRSSAEASSSENPDQLEEQANESVALERRQHLRHPQNRPVIGSSSGAEGQAVDLRSRLSNPISMRGMAADMEKAALEPGRRMAQPAARRGAKSGRGLFGAALTGLQR